VTFFFTAEYCWQTSKKEGYFLEEQKSKKIMGAGSFFVCRQFNLKNFSDEKIKKTRKKRGEF